MQTASREYECIFHPAKRGDIVLDRLAIGVAIVGFEIDASYLCEARRAIQRARTT